MRIENILQALSTQLLHKKGIKTNTQPVNNNEDKVEISSEARNLQKIHINGNQQNSEIKDVNNVREEKIKEVMIKLNENFYSSPSVTSKLVDNLLKMFGF